MLFVLPIELFGQDLNHGEICALLFVYLLESEEHPGRGIARTGLRSPSRDFGEPNRWLNEYANRPDACFAELRQSLVEVDELTVALAPYLARPRPQSVCDTVRYGARPIQVRRYRAPIVDDRHRVAAVLRKLVCPFLTGASLSMKLCISQAAFSNLIRVDLTNFVDGLRDELPALVHVQVLLDTLSLFFLNLFD